MIKLAVDCDGVLSNSFKAWEYIAKAEGVTKRFDTEYNGIYKVRCNDGAIFANKLFGHYRNDWIANAEPYPEVAKFIEKVNWNEGIKWWVVTSRGSDVKDQTLAWLAKHNITGYEDVLFLQDKTQAPCSVLIDDKPSHCGAYNNCARMAYIRDQKYNKDFQTTRRINNLMEVYHELLTFIN